MSLDLDTIRRRADAATRGPWRLVTDSCDCDYGCPHGTFPYALHLPVHTVRSAGQPCIAHDPGDSYWHRASEIGDLTMETAEFIAAARDDVPALLAEIDRLRAQSEAMTETLAWAAREYTQCIVSARASVDGGHYEKCNGRAEAYRQLTERVAAAAGVPCPDWEAIKASVPTDGVYR